MAEPVDFVLLMIKSFAGMVFLIQDAGFIVSVIQPFRTAEIVPNLKIWETMKNGILIFGLNSLFYLSGRLAVD